MKNPASDLNKGDLGHLGVNLLTIDYFMKYTGFLCNSETGCLKVRLLYALNVSFWPEAVSRVI